MVHRSDEQQHYFNTPFQLSIAPPGAEGVVLSDRFVDLHLMLAMALKATQFESQNGNYMERGALFIPQLSSWKFSSNLHVP